MYKDVKPPVLQAAFKWLISVESGSNENPARSIVVASSFTAMERLDTGSTDFHWESYV